MAYPEIKYKHSLSIIIPLYNEAELITHAVDQICAVVEPRFDNYEIVVVESGSTDLSAEVCKRLALENHRIKLISEGARNGYGSGLRTGINAAANDYIWIVTADLPFDLSLIDTAMQLLDKYIFVLSYRSQDPRSPLRKFQSVIFNLLIKQSLGLPFRHINSAFRVLTTRFVQNLDLISAGWFIDAEILYYINKSGSSYIEFPVPLIDRTRGKSNIRVTTFLYVLKEYSRFKKSL